MMPARNDGPRPPDLRSARLSDAETLFAWANTEENIALSPSRSGPMAWPAHLEWLRARLADSGSAIWIAERAGAPVGYVRMQEGSKGPEMSIYLDPEERHLGHGGAMLRFACREAAARWPGKRLLARIIPDNEVSIRLFERAGFRLAADLGDHLLYGFESPEAERP